jgi:hypothetical protein
MEANDQSQIYPVDIALCIDGTGSMADIIGDAKRQALNFYSDFVKAMEDNGKKPGKLRVRVIVFRDLKISEQMESSRFFNLPDELDLFSNEINKIEAKGGGDEPESALEALVEAINSDWVSSQEGLKQRHVVVLWSDASAHADAIKDFSANWESKMSFNSKRLVIFAPELNPWKELAENIDNCAIFFSKAGEGLAEIDYKVIMDQIARSV